MTMLLLLRMSFLESRLDRTTAVVVPVGFQIAILHLGPKLVDVRSYLDLCLQPQHRNALVIGETFTLFLGISTYLVVVVIIVVL